MTSYKKKSLVSIIVPVYNVQDYIKKCVDSIINQDYKCIEIILVDDGSTDKSGKICDTYGSIDNRVSVIHKGNGGLSDARNAGLDFAHGEYITFVDSDDWIKYNFISTLLNISQSTKADLVISELRDVKEGDNISSNQSIPNIRYEVVNKSTCYRKMLLQDGIDVNATAKLYRKNIFNKLRFVKGQLYEDINIVDKVVESSALIAITDYTGYLYLQRKGSIMYGKFSLSRLSLLSATERLIKLMKDKYPENIDAAIHRYVYCNFHLLGRSILDDSNSNVSMELRSNILNHEDEIKNSKLYSRKERFAFLILKKSLKTYKIFWILYKKF